MKASAGGDQGDAGRTGADHLGSAGQFAQRVEQRGDGLVGVGVWVLWAAVVGETDVDVVVGEPAGGLETRWCRVR
ncbi:hypothetical protein [Amycolatopsis sp.]|uniref:hypothetical protein n=1 Tax=Amycolatopsis sp. TaxID=37632 RepID=UPI002B8D49BF|nr:hypothetical protein [Amycolatopsis sp.]HVV09261.1 hypothetical protein [Amycolatopsis sp.]